MAGPTVRPANADRGLTYSDSGLTDAAVRLANSDGRLAYAGVGLTDTDSRLAKAHIPPSRSVLAHSVFRINALPSMPEFAMLRGKTDANSPAVIWNKDIGLARLGLGAGCWFENRFGLASHD